MYGYACSTFHELWKQICDYTIAYNIKKMECRRFGLSTFWCVYVLACRRFGLSKFWSVGVLVCRRFGLSTFWFVDVLVCRRFDQSTFWSVDVSVCRRFGFSTFWFVDVLVVDVSVCRRFGTIASNAQNVSIWWRHHGICGSGKVQASSAQKKMTQICTETNSWWPGYSLRYGWTQWYIFVEYYI